MRNPRYKDGFIKQFCRSSKRKLSLKVSGNRGVVSEIRQLQLKQYAAQQFLNDMQYQEPLEETLDFEVPSDEIVTPYMLDAHNGQMVRNSEKPVKDDSPPIDPPRS